MSVSMPTQQSTRTQDGYAGKERTDETVSPEQASFLPSRLAFSWFSPLVMRMRGGKAVSRADLPPISKDLGSEGLSESFEAAWDGQETNAKMSQSPNRLLWCLISIHKGSFLKSALCHVLAGASLQLTPFALSYFLEIMEDRETGDSSSQLDYLGYLGCFGLFALLLIKTVLGNQGYYIAYKTGIKIRSSLGVAIFNHMLEMSNAAKQIYPAGKTIKLISADILKILNVLDYLHYIWLGPFQILFTFIMVYLAIGWPALLSLGILCLAIPVQFLLTRVLVRNRLLVAQATDRRIKLLQEMILGIRVIKLYAWEELFLRRLEACRAEELRLIRKQNLIYGCSIVLSVVVPAFSTVVAFLAHNLTGHALLASVVSQVSLYFSMLDIPLFNIPLFINTGIDSQASLARIQAFLASERLSSDVQTVPAESTLLGLSIEEGDFDWDARTVGKRKSPKAARKPRPVPRKTRLIGEEQQPHPSRLLTITPNTTYDMEEHTWLDPSASSAAAAEDDSIFCIRDVELKIPRGSLVAIVGPVGSGKSSLLQAILGEMRSDGGSRVQVGGRLAYSPQQAWILNGSLRENILFGRPFDEERYRATLRQCTIDKDVAAMPQGDATLIGEKGISLSGGQKARLNLARAVYADADVVLLDDPLSAVDARVCNQLFQRCILDGLLKEKTRILVTHQLSIIPLVDHVVVMRNGRVAEQGPYAELMRSTDSAFSQMMRRFIQEETNVPPSEEEETTTTLSDSDEEESSMDEPAFEANSTGVLIDPVRPAGVESKTIVSCGPKGSTYSAYVGLAGGTLIACLAVFVIVGNEFFRAGNDLWLTVWMLRSPWALTDAAYRIIYVGFAAGLTLFTWACVLLFTFAGAHAAGRLHSRAVHRMFRSPIGFFEATPLGRILNRFSRDQEVVDTQLSDCLYFWLYIVATILSTQAFLLYVSWRMALALAFVTALVLLLQAVYSACNWKLNKLYSQALSPFLRQVGEVHSGLTVVRTFRTQPLMLARHYSLADQVTRTAFLSMVLKRWTSFRVELLGSFLVLAVAVLCFALRVPSGLAGKILEFTLLVINSMDYFVRQYAELAGNMVAVDRLHAYAEGLESEALDQTQMPELDPAWPRSGAIQVSNLSLAYLPHLPPALNNVSVDIPHGHKVAIVGRTGAGKSTILSALFRLVEPLSGTIFIDGVDIRQISLKQLRSRITIVPQDPVLFSGTIRFNLDPEGAFDDRTIWEALDAVNSREFIAKFPERLETIVQDFGENFSLGQRQLICLARAILHKSPVILMDEPTASMDLQTDQLVQDAIKRCFAGSTLINISHRLGSIKEYDKVIVMDAGKIIEYDSPEALLADPKTVLAQLYAEYTQYQ